jgi:hypothetical protein
MVDLGDHRDLAEGAGIIACETDQPEILKSAIRDFPIEEIPCLAFE